MRQVAWPALVLAAGYGSRLGALGRLRAKAALPVAGRPLIVRVIERLRAAGITRIVINLHHQAASICRIVGDGGPWDVEVRYSWERQLLGSAGGPARALPLLAADRFFIVNADTLSDVDLAALAASHERSGALATLAVTAADLTRYNALVGDGAGRLLGVATRGTDPRDLPAGARPWHFVGVQAVDARTFAGVDPAAAADSLRELYPRRAAERPGSIRVAETTGRFFDVGTPADYLDTVRRLAADEGVALDCGAGTVVDATADASTSILWDRVTVGAGAVLSECIVGDDVAIAPGARYHRRVITGDAIEPL